MQVAIQLSNWQLATLIILPGLIFLAGFVANNSRVSDLKAAVAALNGRIDTVIGMIAEVRERVTRQEGRQAPTCY